jgi:hypothetical protein
MCARSSLGAGSSQQVQLKGQQVNQVNQVNQSTGQPVSRSTGQPGQQVNQVNQPRLQLAA